MTQWFYNVGQESKGPCSTEDLILMKKNRVLTDETFVWREGLSGWLPYSQVEELTSPAPAAPSTRPTPPVAPAPSAPAPAPAPAAPSAPKPAPAPAVSATVSAPKPAPAPAPVMGGAKSAAPAGPDLLETKKQQVAETTSKILDVAGLNESPLEGTCPACGYFVGSGLTCIRCGARSKKYISLKFVRAICLLGSVVGLVLLLFAARAKQPELVEVGAIDIMMNGALVEVEGNITSWEEDEATGGLRFKVDDGTGEITVNAYGKLQALRDFFGENEMPRLGDHISVIGSINETQKFGISLMLALPERVTILNRFVPTVVSIGRISDRNVGEIKLVQCRVASSKSRNLQSGGRMHTLTLDDGSGRIEMSIMDDLLTALKPEQQALLKPNGPEFQCLLRISMYQQRISAKLADPRSLKPATAAAAPDAATAEPETEPAAGAADAEGDAMEPEAGPVEAAPEPVTAIDAAGQ